MNTQKEALILSIAHWERLSKCKTPSEVKAEGYGQKQCPLCILYFHNKCEGCPVSAYSTTYCDDTPYRSATYPLYLFINKATKQFPQKEVDAELSYLKQLLTDMETKS